MYRLTFGVVKKQMHPFTWADIQQHMGVDDYVMHRTSFYDEEACRFLDKTADIPTTARRILAIPSFCKLKQPADTFNALYPLVLETLGQHASEEKVHDSVYSQVGNILDIHPQWVRELHSYYQLQKSLPQQLVPKLPQLDEKHWGNRAFELQSLQFKMHRQ